jgi:hypothetical protein
LATFAAVLDSAWGALTEVRRTSGAQMAQAGPSTRGMLVSDFTREPAHRLFAGRPGVYVDDRYGRPWVNLAGGRVQVRFRKLSETLQLCTNDSGRAARLAFHLGDPVLPGLEPATILTAGYVLNAAEMTITRMVLVCHVGDEVWYSITLPGTPSMIETPTQLPLVPLSPPIIRSARNAAAERLEKGTAAGE